MVFLHGGDFNMGSASEDVYDLTNFVNNNDVVAVSLNYRLGVFGFLVEDEAGTRGNNGLRD